MDEKHYWKGFKVGDLFERSNKHKITASIKELDTSDVKTPEFCIGNVTSSTTNNGIACYLRDDPAYANIKVKNCLTIATDGYVGACFYQDEYVVSTGHNNVITAKDSVLKDILEVNPNVNKFLALCFTKLYQNCFHGFSRSLSACDDFDREIILLPMYKDDAGEEHLSAMFAEHIYLAAEVTHWQKLIDDYTEKENALIASENITPTV